MANSLSIPEIGDYLVFTKNYTFIVESGGVLPVPEGTIVKVVERKFSTTYTDEIECELYITLNTSESTEIFKFNYLIHQNRVSILPNSKALNLLYR